LLYQPYWAAWYQESPQFPPEKEGGGGGVSPPGFNSSQESKAAKVATLSQALGYVDQYRWVLRRVQTSNPIILSYSSENVIFTPRNLKRTEMSDIRTGLKWFGLIFVS
jgi:hypothetical protein